MENGYSPSALFLYHRYLAGLMHAQAVQLQTGVGEKYFEVVRCTANLFFTGNRDWCIAATVVGIGVEHNTIQT